MDPIKKTIQLENVEEKQETEIKKDDDTEEKETNLLFKESNILMTIENNIFFENFAKLEENLVNELNMLKKHNSAVMNSTTSVDEFKKNISNLILSLGRIDDHRELIKIHIEPLLKKDRKIIECIDKKLKLEKIEFGEKHTEKNIR